MTVTEPLNRFDRRKARTRASLVQAAQGLLAEGRTHVPVQEVTQIADVALGTFYNHFDSKDALFEAAVDDALEQLGAFLDAAGQELDDPAEVFARSFRMVGRTHRDTPQLSLVLLNSWDRLASAEVGLAPRARRDVIAAQDAGRFTIDSVDSAMILVIGAALSLGRFIHDHPDHDDAQVIDQVTADLLVALGLERADAADVASRSLTP